MKIYMHRAVFEGAFNAKNVFFYAFVSTGLSEL